MKKDTDVLSKFRKPSIPRPLSPSHNSLVSHEKIPTILPPRGQCAQNTIQRIIPLYINSDLLPPFSFYHLYFSLINQNHIFSPPPTKYYKYRVLYPPHLFPPGPLLGNISIIGWSWVGLGWVGFQCGDERLEV